MDSHEAGQPQRHCHSSSSSVHIRRVPPCAFLVPLIPTPAVDLPVRVGTLCVLHIQVPLTETGTQKRQKKKTENLRICLGARLRRLPAPVSLLCLPSWAQEMPWHFCTGKNILLFDSFPLSTGGAAPNRSSPSTQMLLQDLPMPRPEIFWNAEWLTAQGPGLQLCPTKTDSIGAPPKSQSRLPRMMDTPERSSLRRSQHAPPPHSGHASPSSASRQRAGTQASVPRLPPQANFNFRSRNEKSATRSNKQNEVRRESLCGQARKDQLQHNPLRCCYQRSAKVFSCHHSHVVPSCLTSEMEGVKPGVKAPRLSY